MSREGDGGAIMGVRGVGGGVGQMGDKRERAGVYRSSGRCRVGMAKEEKGEECNN